MKNILWTICLTLLAGSVFAQAEFVIGNATGDPGQTNVCVEVTAGRISSFGSVIEMKIPFHYDPNVVTFTGANINPNGLDGLNNTHFSAPLPGVSGDMYVLLEWAHPTFGCTDDPPFFNPVDEELLFELCFTVNAGANYGDFSPVEILNTDEIPEVGRENTALGDCNEIGFIVDDGVITIGAEPFIINISQEEGFEGDQVCVDFRVSGFNGMRSVQFSVMWDPTLLEFANYIAGDIPNPSPPGVGGNVPAGSLTYSWNFFIPGDEDGITLPDDHVLFTICYDLLSCDNYSPIVITDTPTEIEITNATEVYFGQNVEGTNLTYEFTPGGVTLLDCDPVGLELNVGCPNTMVSLGDVFCVPVTMNEDITNLHELHYIMKWNASVLEFVPNPDISNSELFGISQGDFTLDGVSNGVLGFDYDFSGPPNLDNVNNGDLLYEVCFRVVGLGGNSPMNIVGSGISPYPTATAVVDNGFESIIPDNCVIEINQPPGVVVDITDMSVPNGDSGCLDFTVTNFENITDFQLTYIWDASIFEYGSITNMMLPGANVIDNGSGFGTIALQWTGGPLTLNDGDVLFSLCMDAIGQPGECADVEIVNTPLVAQAISSDSNGENIGVESTPGEACVLFPEGFGLNIPSATGSWSDTLCVPFSLQSFDNILEMGFSVTWGAPELLLHEVINPGTVPGIVLDESNASVGVLGVSLDVNTPTVVADDEIIFELCFILNGPPEDCYPIGITPQNPDVTTTIGTGSILYNEGEICIENQIVLSDWVLTPVSCPGTNDGTLTFNVSDGLNLQGYGATLRGLDCSYYQVDTSAMMEFTQLPACDSMVLTVFSNFNTDLFYIDTFAVMANPNQIFVDAGEDQTINCSTGLALASGNIPNDGFILPQWTDKNGIVVSQGNAFFAQQAGCYIYVLTDNETGCSNQDTIMVFDPILPTIDAGLPQDFTCDTDTLTLMGSGSADGGGNVNYTWTAIEDGFVDPATAEMANTFVFAPGTYELTVLDVITQCEAKDTVVVNDLTNFPNAESGLGNQVLSCADDFELNGLVYGNFDFENLQYIWTDLEGNLLSDSVTYPAAQAGEYILTMTDLDSGCAAADTITLLPGEGYPEVTVTADTSLACNRPQVQLDAEILNDTFPTSILWSSIDGGGLLAGTDTDLNAIVTLPGTYMLQVTNDVSDCITEVFVTVGMDTMAPIAVVEFSSPTDTIGGCNMDVLINGAGSTFETGDTIRWYHEGMLLADNTSEITTSAAGTYILEITSASNGCVGMDSIEVVYDGETPDAIIENFEINYTCLSDTVDLEVATNLNTGTYSILWTTSDGAFVPGTDTTLTPEVLTPGTYSVLITNLANGCEGVNEAIVYDDRDTPTAAASATGTITCINDNVALDGSASSGVTSETVFEWRPASDPMAMPILGQLANTDMAGDWVLTVRDTSNGCFNTALTTVMADTIPRAITIATPDSITCNNEMVTLDASATDGTDAIITWTGLDGAPNPVPADALITTVSDDGQYQLLVRDATNGCESMDTVTVANDTIAPLINLAQAPQITCLQPLVSLDASGSTADADATIEWTAPTSGSIVSGGNTFTPTVDGPGAYTIMITNTNGCSASIAVTVSVDPDTPVADSGEDTTIGCGETTTLDGSNSTQGAGFELNWSAVSPDINDPTPADAVQPTIDSPGTYQLIVVNNNSGCQDTSMVTVTLDVQFGDAEIFTADQTLCADSIDLEANLPAGTTGTWTVSSFASIAAADQPFTTASNLQAGNNVFTWTLSADGCPDFSSAQVAINLEGLPIANNDEMEVTGLIRSASVNVLDNDVLTGIENYNIEITLDPFLGTVDSIDAAGNVYYTALNGTSGVDIIEYTICNLDCPGLCATALIEVNVVAGSGKSPNAITPNDDGLNDTFVFDEILNTPAEEFPDNELIVFNRWGDILYSAKPYNNAWNGTDNDGNPLPDGTYYYVLRLNISEGVIKRGDVTIVR